MAFSGIVFLCLLIVSLMPKAKSNDFFSVECPKSEIIAQYGTNTLLDCVGRPQVKITVSKIVGVTWKLNKDNVLTFNGESLTKNPRIQFAVSSWNDSNLNVSLLITNTKLEDAGDYNCIVVADVGDGDANMHLTVKSNYSKPEIHSDPEKINPNKSFNLTCTARGGYPKGDIRWVVDDIAWKKNPEVKIEKTPNGLYDLTSTLSVGLDSPFRKFVCEVYNANGVIEGQQGKHHVFTGQLGNTNEKEASYTHIVAPVVVIGSLIVGLLAALLLCRKRRQNDPPRRDEAEEQNPMV